MDKHITYLPRAKGNIEPPKEAHKRHFEQINILVTRLADQLDAPSNENTIDNLNQTTRSIFSSIKASREPLNRGIKLSDNVAEQLRKDKDRLTFVIQRIHRKKISHPENLKEYESLHRASLEIQRQLQGIISLDKQNKAPQQVEVSLPKLHQGNENAAVKEPSIRDKILESCLAIRENMQAENLSLEQRLKLIAEISDSIVENLNNIERFQTKKARECSRYLLGAIKLIDEQAHEGSYSEADLKVLGLNFVVKSNLEFLREWFDSGIMAKEKKRTGANNTDPSDHKPAYKFEEIFGSLLKSLNRTSSANSRRSFKKSTAESIAKNDNQASIEEKLRLLREDVIDNPDRSFPREFLDHLLQTYYKFQESSHNDSSFNEEDRKVKLAILSSTIHWLSRRIFSTAESPVRNGPEINSAEAKLIRQKLRDPKVEISPKENYRDFLKHLDRFIGLPTYNNGRIGALNHNLQKVIKAIQSNPNDWKLPIQAATKLLNLMDQMPKLDLNEYSKRFRMYLEQATRVILKTIKENNSINPLGSRVKDEDYDFIKNVQSLSPYSAHKEQPLQQLKAALQKVLRQGKAMIQEAKVLLWLVYEKASSIKQAESFVSDLDLSSRDLRRYKVACLEMKRNSLAPALT